MHLLNYDNKEKLTSEIKSFNLVPGNSFYNAQNILNRVLKSIIVDFQKVYSELYNNGFYKSETETKKSILDNIILKIVTSNIDEVFDNLPKDQYCFNTTNQGISRMYSYEELVQVCFLNETYFSNEKYTIVSYPNGEIILNNGEEKLLLMKKVLDKELIQEMILAMLHANTFIEKLQYIALNLNNVNTNYCYKILVNNTILKDKKNFNFSKLRKELTFANEYRRRKIEYVDNLEFETITEIKYTPSSIKELRDYSQELISLIPIYDNFTYELDINTTRLNHLEL